MKLDCLFIFFICNIIYCMMNRFLVLVLFVLISVGPGFCDESLKDSREQVRFFYNTNDLAQAKNILQRIPERDKTAEDWLLLSNIAQEEQRNMDAVFFLQKAIMLDKDFYKAYYNLGNLYQADGKINAAIENYNKTIKLKKDFSYAYYNLGNCYLKNKNYTKAKYAFGAAIRNNPQEPSFYYNLAYTYKMQKKIKKAQEALNIYNELMKN